MRFPAFPVNSQALKAIRLCACAVAALSFAALASADDPADDDGIPRRLRPEHFDYLFAKSPFRRVLSLSDSLVLTGLAKLPGGPVATVLNRANNETSTVSEKPNAQGWKLVEVKGRNLENVQVRIDTGKQLVSVRFDRAQLRPEVIRRQRKKANPARVYREWEREPWVERLEPTLKRIIGTLAQSRRVEFLENFADYLDRNPDSNSNQRNQFARDSLNSLLEEAEKESEDEESEDEEDESEDQNR